MEKVLGGIADISRIPSAVFIVDIGHEHIALAEAIKLNVTTFGMVDTNCDPRKVDFPIPSNDDATKSIAVITNYLTNAIAEGLEERQVMKDKEAAERAQEEKAKAEEKARKAKEAKEAKENKDKEKVAAKDEADSAE